MLGVRQTDKRELFAFPISGEGFESIRSNGQDFRVTRGERRILVPQAGEMGAAVGSHEPAQERQNNMFLTLKTRQLDCLPI